jgi:P pilus assembly chaperone PapD
MLTKNKLLLLITALFGSATFAQSINISNPRLHILNTHETVKLENNTKIKKAFKYNLYQWNQNNGYIDNNGKLHLQKSSYIPSDDLQVIPRTFVIMPGSERSIRVSLKNNTKPANTNYKLELEEFLLKENINNMDNGADKTNKISLLVKLTLPVFVPKENKITPLKQMDLKYELATYEGNKKALKIINNDTQSLKINNIIVGDSNYQTSSFILNGVTGYIPLPEAAWQGKFKLDTNHGVTNLDLSYIK